MDQELFKDHSDYWQIADNIKNIYLSLPDFDTYIEQGTYHLLNPEHTYYVETQFLENIFWFWKYVKADYLNNLSVIFASTTN